MKEITLGTLFDGIGGFPYAALFYGIRPVWASEVLPTAISVTKRHIPEMVHVGDITKLDGRKLPPVDIITFGSPCQGLSISGRRLGLADERSGLFSEAIRIIREMQEVTHGQYPQIAIWENVPGALSSAGGCDFAAVLQAFTETPVPMPYSGRWANAGMVRSRGIDLAWACTTPNISEQHSDAGACSLSLILEENAPDKYFLSPKACEGILNRAERRGKHLPPLLQAALEEQSRKTDI